MLGPRGPAAHQGGRAAGVGVWRVQGGDAACSSPRPLTWDAHQGSLAFKAPLSRLGVSRKVGIRATFLSLGMKFGETPA